jgi:hypothetical protein
VLFVRHERLPIAELVSIVRGIEALGNARVQARTRRVVPRVMRHYGTGAGISAHNEKPAGEPAGLSVLVEEGRQLVRYSQNPSQRLGETLLRGLFLGVGALTAAAVLDQDWDLRSVPVASNERAQGA